MALIRFNFFPLIILTHAVVLIFFPFDQAHANNACVELFREDPFQENSENLHAVYANEIQFLSNKEISDLNQNFIVNLNNVIPIAQGSRAQSIEWSDASKFISIVRKHPVVGYDQIDRYTNPGSETGFCFGRAMYLHLLALKMGLQKESIKKIWAIGPMQSTTNGITWGYHVALMVYTRTHGWQVIDPNDPRPQSPDSWMRNMSMRSVDQRVRFYATSGAKFGADTGKYGRVMLGLDPSLYLDWFKGYFVDLLKSTRNESLESLGLKRIDIESSYIDPKNSFVSNKKPRSMTEILKDIFWVP